MVGTPVWAPWKQGKGTDQTLWPAISLDRKEHKEVIPDAALRMKQPKGATSETHKLVVFFAATTATLWLPSRRSATSSSAARCSRSAWRRASRGIAPRSMHLAAPTAVATPALKEARAEGSGHRIRGLPGLFGVEDFPGTAAAW